MQGVAALAIGRATRGLLAVIGLLHKLLFKVGGLLASGAVRPLAGLLKNNLKAVRGATSSRVAGSTQVDWRVLQENKTY